MAELWHFQAWKTRLDFRFFITYAGFSMPRVYASFFLRQAWCVQFLLEDLKTPLRKRLTFQSPDKIVEMARRGDALRDSETKAHLEYAIQKGRGGFYLQLTEEQFKKLL